MADLLQVVNFWHENMTDLSATIDFEHEKILTFTLSQPVTSCNFSIFFF
jgi:hypothetical protein